MWNYFFCFFLAATGDVEEDGGLSDSIQTSKMIPAVCLGSSPPHPRLSHSVPDFFLSGSAGSTAAPRTVCQGASGQNRVPRCSWQGLGGFHIRGDPGLVRPHAQAEKAAGPLAACPFCCCLAKEEQGRGNPQRVPEAKVGPCSSPRREGRGCLRCLPAPSSVLSPAARSKLHQTLPDTEPALGRKRWLRASVCPGCSCA